MLLCKKPPSYNPCLLSLDLMENMITDDVGVEYFCRFWKNDSQLQDLMLRSNAIDAVGARMLLMAAVHTTLPFCKLVLANKRQNWVPWSRMDRRATS